MATADPASSSGAPARLSFAVFAIALAYFALHMLTASRYGYFRDALYYLACTEHLAWGYVDQPPLIVFAGWLVRHTIGTSLYALLLVPALSGAARIVLTAAFARELGARRFGMALAALLAAVPDVWHAIDHQFAMNTFEPLFWTGCAYALLRMIKTGNPRYWLLFGLLAGFGLENKYSMAFFAFALLFGLLLTPQRKLLFSGWLFAGGAIAALIFLPNALWNFQHHWPFLELMHNIRASGRDVVLSPPAFFAQQILIMGLSAFPFWLAGALSYFFHRDLRPYRMFGWAFLSTLAIFLLLHGKNYYSAPSYPMVFAAGAFVVESWLAGAWFHARVRLRSVLRPACFVWLIAGAALVLPVALPVLPIDAYIRYQSHLPFVIPKSEHGHMGVVLPQHYADEFGWEEMVAAVARVYHSLPPGDQAKTAIFANNYGEAGAIDFFGPRYGLPKAISGHQNYFLWGPRDYTGEIVIVVGSDNPENDRRFFESVEIAATHDNPYGENYEKSPILLCRHLRENLQTLWPRLKKWD